MWCMKLDLVVGFLLLSSLSTIVESRCNRGCDLALASYYVQPAVNMTFIAAVFEVDANDILRYNPQVPNLDSIQADARINIPFSCNCLGGQFLGHAFLYNVLPGDRYDTIATRFFANLTTEEMLQRFNRYDPTSIPIVNARLNVTVNCSCGDARVSKDYGVFATCPLRQDDSLDSIAAQVDVSADLLRRYNPNANFSAGTGLVYLPIKGIEGSIGSQGGSNSEKRRKVAVIVGLALMMSGLILSLSITLYVSMKKKMRKQQQEKLKGEVMEGNKKEDLELPLFNLATISNATNNFSINNKLGEGGFGPVYKGMLEDGQEIAVKRLSKYSSQGFDEFRNEVICIAKLQHRNLVRLLGCCIEGEEKMLVYEFMPNNSLESFIFDQTQSKILDWPKRFSIINGIARGLLYLHQDSRLRVIHRDIKASNVLLDSAMNPKVSDFGLARRFGGDETEANTNRVVGTYGYMSPEYAGDGLFSVKSDVFSFGVLVLEIVSGKRNRRFFHPGHNHNLLGHAWMLYKEGRSLELLDTNLGSSCNESEVLQSINVGLLCVQQCPGDRPSMSSVVLMLGHDGALPQSKEPGFFINENGLHFDDGHLPSNHGPISANEMTITLLDAR